MLEVHIDTREETTVVKLSGRLDVNGAVLLERRLGEMPGRSPDLILDLGEVDFVSSAGIRVLTQLLKESAAREGSVVLSGMKPAVRNILEITGMLGFFAVVDSQEKAALRLRDRRRLAHSRRRVTIGEIHYDTTTDADADCAFQLWSPEPSQQGTLPLFRATLQELNLAFGLGGLGSDAADASHALGEFLCTGTFVAVVPTGSGGLADCLIPREEATTDIFVARAVGFSGKPRVRARLMSPDTVTLGRLVNDAFSLAEAPGETPPNILGLAIHTGPAVVSGGFYADEPVWREDQFSETESEASATLILAVAGRSRPAIAGG